MSEVLEGVLSETMLDELASDLGCDPNVMRKHPFFRVLKGRVLLTYPLRVAGGSVFKTMEPATFTSQMSPEVDTFYPVLETTNARIKWIIVKQVFTEARLIDIKITVDTVVFQDETGIDVTHQEEWYVSLIPTYLGGKKVAMSIDKVRFDDVEGRNVKVEIRAREAMAGCRVYCTVYYEQCED